MYLMCNAAKFDKPRAEFVLFGRELEIEKKKPI
jgi:hypothetical protein